MKCPVCGTANATCKGATTSVGVHEDATLMRFGPITERNEAPEMLMRIGEITMEEQGQIVSEERLYLDKDGNVVGEKDPNKLTLLVAKGGSMSMAMARKHGLVKDGDVPAEAEGGHEDKVESMTDPADRSDKVESISGKAKSGPPENKARTKKKASK